MKIIHLTLLVALFIVLSGCSYEGYARNGWVSLPPEGGGIDEWPTNEDIFNGLKNAHSYSSLEDCAKAANEYLKDKSEYHSFQCSYNCRIEKSKGYVEEGSPLYIKCEDEKNFGYKSPY